MSPTTISCTLWATMWFLWQLALSWLYLLEKFVNIRTLCRIQLRCRRISMKPSSLASLCIQRVSSGSVGHFSSSELGPAAIFKWVRESLVIFSYYLINRTNIDVVIHDTRSQFQIYKKANYTFSRNKKQCPFRFKRLHFVSPYQCLPTWP